MALGYTTYKFKCRPWWDPLEQVTAVAKAAPPGFRLWLDFNGHLREARQAIPILNTLAQYECVRGFESPIPQRDVEGYKRIREMIDKPIALHYGSGCCHVVSDRSYDPGVPAENQLREQLCDGFVLGGSDVDQLRSIAGVCHEFRKPFWIQTVGTALRAAWIAHAASTCRAALLSHLAAHDQWLEDVVATPVRPRDGGLAVPDRPGLGVEVEEAGYSPEGPPEPEPVVSQPATSGEWQEVSAECNRRMNYLYTSNAWSSVYGTVFTNLYGTR